MTQKPSKPKTKRPSKPRQTPATSPAAQGPDALVDFIAEAASWLQKIRDILSGHDRTASEEEEPSRLAAIMALKERQLPELRAAQAELIRIAHEKGVSKKVEPPLKTTIDLLSDHMGFIRHGLISAISSQSSYANVVESAGPLAQAEQLLQELELLGPLLSEEEPGLPPLTDAQKDVWHLLDGQQLTSRQIADKLDPQLSDSAIRQRVKCICETGRVIISQGVSGYYRPDALPTLD